MKIKFYLAASFKKQAEIKEIREQLQTMGHTVTSRWIEAVGIHDYDTEQARAAAELDFADIDACEVFLVFTDEPSTTGGHFVEFGYAYAHEKVCMVIGKRLNVFHRLAQSQFDDWNDLLRKWPL